MQLRELRAYAQARGWEIATEFKDEGWSGASRVRQIGPHSRRSIAPDSVRLLCQKAKLNQATQTKRPDLVEGPNSKKAKKACLK